MTKSILDRLGDKMLVGDGCWEWTGAKQRGGYGHLSIDGRSIGAHRVVFELLKGPIPAGLDLDHLCRNPGCVRPDHLEPVTRQVNLRRAPEMAWGHRGRWTECRKGHPLSGDNLKIQASGARACRACERERERQYYRDGRYGRRAK